MITSSFRSFRRRSSSLRSRSELLRFFLFPPDAASRDGLLQLVWIEKDTFVTTDGEANAETRHAGIVAKTNIVTTTDAIRTERHRRIPEL